MDNKIYTTKTASLKATVADIRKLNSKYINACQFTINDKPIIENVYDIRGENAGENDLWPNGVQTDKNGNITIYPLGYNKIDICTLTDNGFIRHTGPDYKIIDNIGYSKDNLVKGFIDTKALISRDTSKETDYEFCQLFVGDSDIAEFNSDLSNLEYGGDMSKRESERNRGIFQYCTNLKTFTSDLSSLIDGTDMFNTCTNLITFNADLPKLRNGYGMFGNCESLKYFDNDLSRLETAEKMFRRNLEFQTFSSDLNSLALGSHMFAGCKKLSSFNSTLNSLIIGSGMFNECILDMHSLNNIINFIPEINDDIIGDYNPTLCGELTLGLGIPDTDEARQETAEFCCLGSWEELEAEFTTLGWTKVEFQFNGETTYNLRNTGKSGVWVKLEEVTEDSFYNYKSADDTKFYNLHWYHRTNRTSNDGFTKFNSLSEAIEYFNIIEA
jgi:hypothetical protein